MENFNYKQAKEDYSILQKANAILQDDRRLIQAFSYKDAINQFDKIQKNAKPSHEGIHVAPKAQKKEDKKQEDDLKNPVEGFKKFMCDLEDALYQLKDLEEEEDDCPLNIDIYFS